MNHEMIPNVLEDNSLHRKLRRLRSRLNDYRYFHGVRRFLGQVRWRSNELSGKRIVFNTVRSYLSTTHLHSDLFIGLNLARAGAEVRILLDDGLMEHWDTVRQSWRRFRLNTADNRRNSILTPYKANEEARIDHERKLARLLDCYRHPNLIVQHYSSLIGSPPNLGEIPLTERDYQNAERSVIRFFEHGIMDLSCPEQDYYYRLSIQNCRVAKAVAAYVCHHMRPDLVLISHGFYSTWGPSADVVEAARVSLGVYDVHPYRNGYLQLNPENAEVANQAEYRQFRQKPLLEDDRRAALEVLRDRTSLNSERVSVYFSQFNGRFKTFTADRQSDRQRVFVAYPNVAWDVISAHPKSQFAGILDWLSTTVHAIRESSNRLLIRFHPSETSDLIGARPLSRLLKEHIEGIEDAPNIVLIESDENVNSYQLAREAADVALVFNGTPGHEIPFLDVPVIAASEGRFASEFVYTPDSREQYVQWIRNPDEVVDDFKRTKEERLEELFKYVAYTYFHNAYRVPVLHSSNHRLVDYRTQFSSEEIQPIIDRVKELCSFGCLSSAHIGCCGPAIGERDPSDLSTR